MAPWIIILCALLIGGALILVLAAMATAARREERAAENAEAAQRTAQADARAAEAQARVAADQRRHEAFLATVQTPEKERVVKFVTTRLGGYERVEINLDPSKRFLESADRAADLCKQVDLSSPGCASLRIGPGRDVILAGRGLSHDPLHGDPTRRGPLAQLVAVFAANQPPAAPTPDTTPTDPKAEPQRPANGTTPTPTAEACKCALCSAPAEPRPGGGFHRLCATCHARQAQQAQKPPTPAGGGRVVIQPRPGSPAAAKKEEELVV